MGHTGPVRIAVTGAAGRVGRQVAGLLAAGGHEVLGVVRRPDADLPPGVRPAPADYTDPAALRRAFAGVPTLVLVSADGPAVDVLVQHGNLVTAAAAAGVQRVVALSGLDADPGSPFCYGVTYGHTERLLRSGGGAVALARASLFAEFVAGAFLPAARATGELRLPTGGARMSLVSTGDVARCLAALATDGTTGVVEVTGPEALDAAGIAARAARCWGVPVRAVDVTPHRFHAALAADGTDPWWCYAFASMFASVREGRWERVGDAVPRLTGRPATSLDTVLGPGDAAGR